MRVLRVVVDAVDVNSIGRGWNTGLDEDSQQPLGQNLVVTANIKPPQQFRFSIEGRAHRHIAT